MKTSITVLTALAIGTSSCGTPNLIVKALGEKASSIDSVFRAGATTLLVCPGDPVTAAWACSKGSGECDVLTFKATSPDWTDPVGALDPKNTSTPPTSSTNPGWQHFTPQVTQSIYAQAFQDGDEDYAANVEIKIQLINDGDPFPFTATLQKGSSHEHFYYFTDIPNVGLSPKLYATAASANVGELNQHSTSKSPWVLFGPTLGATYVQDTYSPLANPMSPIAGPWKLSQAGLGDPCVYPNQTNCILSHARIELRLACRK